MFTKFLVFSVVVFLIAFADASRPSLSGRAAATAVGAERKQKFMNSESVVSFIASAKKTADVTADEPKVSLNGWDLFLCGAFATAIADVTMHPIDTIKVTQQGAAVALGAIATAKKIFETGGVAGFYPGVWAYLIGDGLGNAIKLATFELSKISLEKRLPLKFHPSIQFLCGAGAMLACSVLLVPGEVIKTRLQTGLVDNMAQAVRETLKQDGFWGLFAGYYATLVRDIPYTMLELGKLIGRDIKSFIADVDAFSW
jgi:hypothetical protein